MFNFIKNLFKSNKCCCESKCKCNSQDIKESLDIVITRRNQDIILPYDIEDKLKKENISISVTKYKGKPSCVQLSKVINGKSKYCGTLKAYMNVKEFKDGDVCNFSRNNLIF